MKKLLKGFILLLMLLSIHFVSAIESNKKEILLRLPLLSDKNAQIISKALESVEGVEKIEACFELKVLMIEYDSEKIIMDSYLVELINDLKLNTVAEKIFESDIPIIKSNYKITKIFSREKVTN